MLSFVPKVYVVIGRLHHAISLWDLLIVNVFVTWLVVDGSGVMKGHVHITFHPKKTYSK